MKCGSVSSRRGIQHGQGSLVDLFPLEWSFQSLFNPRLVEDKVELIMFYLRRTRYFQRFSVARQGFLPTPK